MNNSTLNRSYKLEPVCRIKRAAKTGRTLGELKEWLKVNNVHLTKCAQNGLNRLVSHALRLKNETVFPAVVDVNLLADRGTLNEAMNNFHPTWKRLHSTAPIALLLGSWEDYQKEIGNHGVLVFCTDTFVHKGKNSLLTVSSADGHPVIGCVGTDEASTSNMKLLFHR